MERIVWTLRLMFDMLQAGQPRGHVSGFSLILCNTPGINPARACVFSRHAGNVPRSAFPSADGNAAMLFTAGDWGKEIGDFQRPGIRHVDKGQKALDPDCAFKCGAIYS